MLGNAMVGEKCGHCGRQFAHNETVNLVGNKAYCPPGSNCTGRVLERRGVLGINPSGLTGLLHAAFVSPQSNNS